MFPRFIATSLTLLIAALPASSFAAECSGDHPESFDEFLPVFSASRTFAVSRTVLPLAVVKWSDGFDIQGKRFSGPEKHHLSLTEYWQWPTLNDYVRDTGLSTRVASRSATATDLDIYKDSSNWLVTYHFTANEGCWFLAQYEGRPI